MSDNIVLIGFMGSGKSTIGRILSFKVKKSFEDTDKLIEKKTGLTVNEIFEAQGEESFRRMENELLKDISRRSYGVVLSLGGGTPVSLANREIIKGLGTVIYLRASEETVYAHTKNRKFRPLLNCDDPIARIHELMSEREKAYIECADIVIDTDKLNIKGVVKEVCKALNL